MLSTSPKGVAAGLGAGLLLVGLGELPKTETSLESTIQTLRNSLEYVREQEVREREEKILLHRPRHADSSAGGAQAVNE